MDDPMDAMAQMMRDLMGGPQRRSVEDVLVPVPYARAVEELFVPKDLKPGDKVRIVPCFADTKVPVEGQVCEVCAVISPAMVDPAQQRFKRYDFTLLFVDKDSGQFIEYPFDSRRFEKV